MKQIIEKRRPWQLVQNQKGQALIFITLAFVVLGMFIGLAVDGGRAYLMRERLRKIVDAASLAGAKAMAGVAEGSDLLAAVKNAACESAMINGLSREDCSTAKLATEIGEVTNPDGSKQQGVIVTGTDTGRTFFMALGGLIGCESCTNINVAATGQAAPDTLVDVVLVLDDTGTMHCDPTIGCPIEDAKTGAKTLISMMLGATDTHALVAFVPFRGCYGDNSGCIRLADELQDLTKDASALNQQIEKRHGDGGYPGTNVCLGIHEGRKKLFGRGSRAIARKVMVLLTDGDQGYSDGANGGIPNLGNPTPKVYPTSQYVAGSVDGQTGYDAGSEPNDAAYSIPGGCMPLAPLHPGDAVPGGFVPDNYNPAVNRLDALAMAKANTMKQADPSGTNVEIYVLRFAKPAGDDLATGTPPGSCDPTLVGTTGVDRTDKNPLQANDLRDRNLSRCLASNTANGDPFAETDHYFYAATPAAITAQFQAIATSILRKRRLVG